MNVRIVVNFVFFLLIAIFSSLGSGFQSYYDFYEASKNSYQDQVTVTESSNSYLQNVVSELHVINGAKSHRGPSSVLYKDLSSINFYEAKNSNPTDAPSTNVDDNDFDVETQVCLLSNKKLKEVWDTK